MHNRFLFTLSLILVSFSLSAASPIWGKGPLLSYFETFNLVQEQPKGDPDFAYPQHVNNVTHISFPNRTTPDFLDNSLSILQDQTNHIEPIDYAEMSETLNRPFFINCNSKLQKINAEKSAKFLDDVTEWRWADVLFSLHEDAETFYEPGKGRFFGGPGCEGKGLGEECADSNSWNKGRLGFLHVVHIFRNNNIDEDYRLWIKSLQCVGDTYVAANIHVAGTAVARVHQGLVNSGAAPAALLGAAVKKASYDLSTLYTFEFRGDKIIRQTANIPQGFLDQASTTFDMKEAKAAPPFHVLKEADTKERLAFDIVQIKKLNDLLKKAGEAPMEIPKSVHEY